MKNRIALIVLVMLTVSQFASAAQYRLISDNFLDTGNRWDYSLNVSVIGGSYVGTADIQVIGPQNVAGYDTQKIEFMRIISLGTEKETFFWRISSGNVIEVREQFDSSYGYWCVETVTNNNPQETFPVYINDSDNHTFLGSGNYSGTDPYGSYTGTSNNYITYLGHESVTVPAGVYDCIYIRTEGDWQDAYSGWNSSGWDSYYIWFSPDIGIVKMQGTEYDDDERIDFDMELTWTNVTPPPVVDSYEPDDTDSQANWIYSSTPQTHSIVPAGDVDWLKFLLVRESEVIIETSGAAGNTQMWLYDSSISEIEYNDDGGAGSFSRIDRLCGLDALPEGTYYVAISEYGNDDEIPSYDITLTVTACDASGTSPVYRFWSPVNERHFYTMVEAEKEKLINLYAHVWTFESIAYYAFETDSVPGLVPVYRFWSPVLIAHFYTINESEKDKLINLYSHVWTYEGIAFYAYPEGQQPVDTLPVYRFWSGTLETHFYTIYETEKNKLIDNYPHVWTYEGTAWYAYE